MTDQLKFPKAGAVARVPVPGDDNFAAQMVEALEGIQESIASVQNTLDILILTLTMEEPADAGDPK